MNDPTCPPVKLDYLPRRIPRPKIALSHKAKRTICLLSAVNVLFLAPFTFVPTFFEIGMTSPGTTQMVIMRPGIASLIVWLVPTGVILALLACGILLKHRRYALGIGFLLASLLVNFSGWFHGTTRELFKQWDILDEVSVADGTRYCFIETPHKDGPSGAIGRLQQTGWFYKTVDVLRGPTHRSRYFVRPSTSILMTGDKLYLASGDRLLVGVFHNCQWCVVYDIAEQRYYDSSEITKLSPHLLLNKASQSPPP